MLLPEFHGEVNSERMALVKDIVPENSKKIVICATLGGRTGSYYAPLIALHAYTKGCEVHTLCSLPFRLEGEQRLKRAVKATYQLYHASHILIIQNNDLLITHFPSIPIGDLDLNMPMIKCYRQLIEDCHSMRGHTSVEDLMSVLFPEMPMEERIKRFYKI